MIHIMINWDFISPVMQTVSGIAVVHYVIDSVKNKWETVAEFRVKVEPGSIGYQSLDGKGIKSSVLNAIQPQLDIMAKSYQKGVTLNKDSFTWIIDDELDNAREELRKISSQYSNDDKIFEMMKSDEER